MATWLAADYGGQSCMAAASWCRTSSGSMVAPAEGYLSGSMVLKRFLWAGVAIDSEVVV